MPRAGYERKNGVLMMVPRQSRVETTAKMNAAEVALLKRMSDGGKKCSDIVRHGWPDFMIRRDDGRVFGVEVKAARDLVRPNQAKAFEFLESIGVDVFVWTPGEDPVPWRASPKTPACYRGKHHAHPARREAKIARMRSPAFVRKYVCGPQP